MEKRGKHEILNSDIYHFDSSGFPRYPRGSTGESKRRYETRNGSKTLQRSDKMIKMEHLTNGAVRVTLENGVTRVFSDRLEAIQFILGV
jgi:hypothetical protein